MDGTVSSKVNFQFHTDLSTSRYWIENSHPLLGESLFYKSGKKDNTYVTYATIAYLPNLDGNGHVLLLQGIDSAGTQAAFDFITRNAQEKAILNPMSAITKGYALGFEILIEVDSLDSAAHTTNFRVISSRSF